MFLFFDEKALLLLAAGIGTFIYNHRVLKPRQKNPTVILSNDGINTYAAGFREWKDISNEEVHFFNLGEDSYHALVYDYPSGSEKIELDFLKTDVRSLNHLLYIYRKRYEQANTD